MKSIRRLKGGDAMEALKEILEILLIVAVFRELFLKNNGTKKDR